MTTEEFSQLDFDAQNAIIDAALDETMQEMHREEDACYPWPCPTCGGAVLPLRDKESRLTGFWDCFCGAWGTTYPGATAYYVGHERIRQ